MQVRSIVASLCGRLRSSSPALSAGAGLGGSDVMDHGWIQTWGSASHMTVQLGLAAEGGSGAAVPLRSIEVDDLDEALRRAQALGAPIVYSLRPGWGACGCVAVLRVQPAGAYAQ